MERRGTREEKLTAKDIAIMLACECDETWQTLRNMRPDARRKLLSAVRILVQEVVEDNGLTERFRNWEKRWGEDEFDACVLHHDMYGMLERHMMGITAAQHVWQPEGGESDDSPPPEMPEEGGEPSGQAPIGAAGSGEAYTPDGQTGNGAEVNNNATSSGFTSSNPGPPARERIRQKTTP